MHSMVLRLLLFGAVSLSDVSGHGRMIEPPSRASMWRYGFDTPPNYDDNESYCGGLARLELNKGKCGVCGDPWDMKTPRPHEAGGKYATNKIARRYTTGDTLPVKIELTANHMGYFEFRVCPAPEEPDVEVTEECLEENILIGEDGETRFYPGDGNTIFEMNYTLPEDMTCDRCVLQWKYVAGNNWGVCEDGTRRSVFSPCVPFVASASFMATIGRPETVPWWPRTVPLPFLMERLRDVIPENLGCGLQEQFRACADIAIGTDEDRRSEPMDDYDRDEDVTRYQYDDVDDECDEDHDD